MAYAKEIFWGFLLIVAVLWIRRRKQHFSVFKNLGIPGPTPNLLFGNILELYKKGPIQCHEDWVRKYGRVLGYFYGMKAILLIADPEILKNIFIKDFNKFTDREVANPLYDYDALDKNNKIIVFFCGEKWKEGRRAMTPAFTAAKMKQMESRFNSPIETLMNILKEKAERDEVFDIHDAYKRVTLDIFTRTAFGFQADFQTEKKSRFFRAMKAQFTLFANFGDPVIFIGLCFPVLRWICLQVQFLIISALNGGSRPDLMVYGILREALGTRRKNPQVSENDLFQSMIDLKIYSDATDVKEEYLEAGITEYETKLGMIETFTKSFRRMTDTEITSTSLLLLGAGYESTSATLAFATYLLGKFPAVQEELHDTIHKMVQDGQKLEYSTVNNLKYLDKILYETMRLYPTAYLFAHRYAVEEVHYGAFRIPKGTLVQVPAYFLHHDPDVWDNPEHFHPERFSNKVNTKGIHFLPYGAGPRNCLGMRFAQLEMKCILAHLVHNFKITISDEQKDHLGLVEGIRSMYPKGGVQVKLQLRLTAQK